MSLNDEEKGFDVCPVPHKIWAEAEKTTSEVPQMKGEVISRYLIFWHDVEEEAGTGWKFPFALINFTYTFPENKYSIGVFAIT